MGMEKIISVDYVVIFIHRNRNNKITNFMLRYGIVIILLVLNNIGMYSYSYRNRCSSIMNKVNITVLFQFILFTFEFIYPVCRPPTYKRTGIMHNNYCVILDLLMLIYFFITTIDGMGRYGLVANKNLYIF